MKICRQPRTGSDPRAVGWSCRPGWVQRTDPGSAVRGALCRKGPGAPLRVGLLGAEDWPGLSCSGSLCVAVVGTRRCVRAVVSQWSGGASACRPGWVQRTDPGSAVRGALCRKGPGAPLRVGLLGAEDWPGLSCSGSLCVAVVGTRRCVRAVVSQRSGGASACRPVGCRGLARVEMFGAPLCRSGWDAPACQRGCVAKVWGCLGGRVEFFV